MDGFWGVSERTMSDNEAPTIVEESSEKTGKGKGKRRHNEEAPSEESRETPPEKQQDEADNDDDDDDEWIGPLPSEAAAPKKKKGGSKLQVIAAYVQDVLLFRDHFVSLRVSLVLLGYVACFVYLNY